MTASDFRRDVSDRLAEAGVAWESINRHGWRYISLCHKSGWTPLETAASFLPHSDTLTFAGTNRRHDPEQ